MEGREGLEKTGDGCLQRVFPDTALECFWAGVLKGADVVGVVVDVAAFQRVLEAPSHVQVFGLEEANEASISSIFKG